MNQLSKAVFAAMLLASFSAIADSNYPASDFKPKVIYSDGSSTAAPSTSAAKPAEKVEADPNYPATNFQPKVLFSADDYKHSSEAPSASSRAATATSAAEAVSEETAVSSNNNLIGLLVLAAIGFVLYKAKCGPKKSATASAAASDSSVTGVERYLEKQGINKTGVAKYLEKQNANPATGVAKYVAKQVFRDKAAAAAKATGVEKYLQKNG